MEGFGFFLLSAWLAESDEKRSKRNVSQTDFRTFEEAINEEDTDRRIDWMLN